MANGIALTIGLNAVDPKHYAGWSGVLAACEADAKDMAKIATFKKFQVETLLTKEATRAKVMEKVSKVAKDLKSGDIFLLTYSGHGGQLPDLNHEELDERDETWCLFDGQLVDDELNSMFAEFSDGVRILVFSDSCHSGTATRGMDDYGRPPLRSPSGEPLRKKSMPREYLGAVYRDNQAFYDKILKKPSVKEEDIKASTLLISGCQDNQSSYDGERNGLFTSNLLAVWKDGKFSGNYRKIHRDIVRRMPMEQTPNYYPTGLRNYRFEYQKPFTI
ncbi:MAG TPA: caspase family protein [Methanothrix sp.]|nr:caspase family protein [Methanothrix sp.]